MLGALALGAGTATLAAQVRAARRAERVARACHELRGPLSALSLGLSLASRTGALTPARVRALEQELARAAQALDDLADPPTIPPARGPARTRPGMRRALPGEVAVDALLSGSVEAWRPAATGRELRLEAAAAAGVTVHGSRARLAQATGNLIQNALEHGDGPVTVRARCTCGVVRIEVRDAGRGLPVPLAQLLGRQPGVESLALLFGRCGAAGAWPRARRGRGHGLRIVAEIARDHGGRLTAAPSEQGARIVLELPIAGGDRSTASASSA